MMNSKESHAVVLMGVSGCGKTSIGRALSSILGWPFYDGDDYHPQANINKMAQGLPLEDADRQPWLRALNQLIQDSLDEDKSLLVASSALKRSYRQTLRTGVDQVRFVYLKGDFDLIFARMQDRAGHYMKPEMLRSQFQVLEEPEDALWVSIDQPVEALASEIIAGLNLKPEIS